MMMNFYLWFVVSLLLYIIHSVAGILHRKVRRQKILHYFASFAAFFSWFSWWMMVWSDQPRIVQYTYIIIPIGIFISLIGCIMYILSVKELKGFENSRGLVTSGIYGKIRHPMYLAWLLIIVGVPLATGSLYALYTVPVWLIFLIFWRVSEEKELEAKYGDKYRQYRKRKWF